MQTYHDTYGDYNVKTLMICAESNSASQVLSWLNSHGVTTVTALLNGGGAYWQYGNGYVPYNVFLDSDFIVRYTASGFNTGYYNTWCNLAEQYGGSCEYPTFEDLTNDIVLDENGDGFPNPGEICEMTLTVSNNSSCPNATGVTGTVTSADPDITILSGGLTFPSIPAGASGTSDNTVIFMVDGGAAPQVATFEVAMDANELVDPQVLHGEITVSDPCDAPTVSISYTILETMAFATLYISGGSGVEHIIEKSAEPFDGFELLGMLPNTPDNVETWTDLDEGRWFYRVKSNCP